MLIVDQFEEIFSRFGDMARAAASELARPNTSSFRTRFFRALREMYEAERPFGPASTESGAPGDAPPGDRDADGADDDEDLPVALPQPFPIRYVLSMRDEWIAQLDPLRDFVPGFDNTKYHLTFLRSGESEAIIKTAAEAFGAQFPPLLAG